MLFVPQTFMSVTLPLTQAYAAHAATGDEYIQYTFSGVSLSTADATRYIVACIGANEIVTSVKLDNVSMTKLGPRTFILAKPTGATGTFVIDLWFPPDFCSLVVFAIYGMDHSEPYDTDHYTRFDNPNIPLSCEIDVPDGGVALGYFNAAGEDDDNSVTTSGLTVRLNTTDDGRRVWAGSDTFVDAVTNKTWNCYNNADAQWLSMVSFGPTITQQVSPSALGTNLIGWWDPSESANRTLVSGKVSQLADKSGHAYNLTQGTDAYRPTLVVGGIGGRDCMSFADIWDTVLVKDGLPLGGTSFDVFAVIRMSVSGTGDWNRLLSFVGAGYTYDYDNAASFSIVRPSFDNALEIGRDIDDIAITDIAYDTNLVIAAYVDGSYGGILKNLYEAAVRNPTSGTFGSTGYFRLGDGSSGSDGWNGYIGEVVFAKNLTRTQRRGVYSYLKTRWSIA